MQLPTAAVRRCEVLPEKRMVDVSYPARGMSYSSSASERELTAAVELERGLELDVLLGSLRLRIRLFGGVQAGYVRLMMFCMVQGHNLARDVWLEGLCGDYQRHVWTYELGKASTGMETNVR